MTQGEKRLTGTYPQMSLNVCQMCSRNVKNEFYAHHCSPI